MLDQRLHPSRSRTVPIAQEMTHAQPWQQQHKQQYGRPANPAHKPPYQRNHSNGINNKIKNLADTSTA